MRNKAIDAPNLRYLKDYFPGSDIGRETYADGGLFFVGLYENLHIGNFTSFASGCQILVDVEHNMDWVTTYPFSPLWECAKNIPGHPKNKGPVWIGSDVLVSTDSLILSGVTIGDGAVIGAKAVVTKNVPPYGIAVGNPATVIKRRFSDEVIERLLKIKWWDWTDEKIARAIPLMLKPDFGEFLDRAEEGRI